jgi:hypothetical protein
MTNLIDDPLTYAIIGAAIAIAVIAWIALLLVPAVKSYWRLRDRVLAGVLSLYVLGAFVLAGAGIGAVVLWYYDRI